MKKKTRTILFLICLVLFLFIAPTAVFYSQGYRFDFESKSLTQTGGFFLKAEPKAVEIYINGKLTKKTDFIFGSALVENLLPKKYKIEIKKEGYLSWEKKLEIREKEVTEVKNLVLFPRNLNFNILFGGQKNGGVENFWFSPDEKKIIFKEREEQGWALKLYDLEKNLKSHLISELEISPQGADLMDLKFSEKNEVYLDLAIEGKKKDFLLEIEKSTPFLKEREITKPPENIIANKIINNDFYYLDNLGNLFKNGEKINIQSFPIQPETKYSLEIFQDFLFLEEGENLYLFSPDSKSFEKFFEKINGLKISPDNKKLAFFSDSEIWILFLKSEGVKKAGEKLFLARFSERISNIFWLNSDFLIFNSGNNIKIVEIDDRDKIQIWDIANFPEPEIYFNESNKKLYILSQGILFVSQKLF